MVPLPAREASHPVIKEMQDLASPRNSMTGKQSKPWHPNRKHYRCSRGRESLTVTAHIKDISKISQDSGLSYSSVSITCEKRNISILSVKIRNHHRTNDHAIKDPVEPITRQTWPLRLNSCE